MLPDTFTIEEKISIEDNAELRKDVTVNVIEIVFRLSSANKTPGLDSFYRYFYKHY